MFAVPVSGRPDARGGARAVVAEREKVDSEPASPIAGALVALLLSIGGYLQRQGGGVAVPLLALLALLGAGAFLMLPVLGLFFEY